MFVYIIFSDTINKFYVGSTQDLNQRIYQHNTKKGKFTDKGIPWKLIHAIEVLDRSTAVQLEKKIKKRGARRFLNDIGML